MAFSFPALIQAAIDRLTGLYNGGRYDASTNPGGLTGNGHRTNFVPALQDVGAVVGAVGTAADAASKSASDAGTAAQAAAQDRTQTGLDRVRTGKDAAQTGQDRQAVADALGSIASGPVFNVNGKTGAVTLTAADVGAADSDALARRLFYGNVRGLR